MTKRLTLYRLKMLKDFEHAVSREKEKLLNELIDNATDPIIQKRRFRMLSQLSLYESQIIMKIQALETDCEKDFLDPAYIHSIYKVTDRNG